MLTSLEYVQNFVKAANQFQCNFYAFVTSETPQDLEGFPNSELLKLMKQFNIICDNGALIKFLRRKLLPTVLCLSQIGSFLADEHPGSLTLNKALIFRPQGYFEKLYERALCDEASIIYLLSQNHKEKQELKTKRIQQMVDSKCEKTVQVTSMNDFMQNKSRSQSLSTRVKTHRMKRPNKSYLVDQYILDSYEQHQFQKLEQCNISDEELSMIEPIKRVDSNQSFRKPTKLVPNQSHLHQMQKCDSIATDNTINEALIDEETFKNTFQPKITTQNSIQRTQNIIKPKSAPYQVKVPSILENIVNPVIELKYEMQHGFSMQFQQLFNLGKDNKLLHVTNKPDTRKYSNQIRGVDLRARQFARKNLE